MAEPTPALQADVLEQVLPLVLEIIPGQAGVRTDPSYQTPRRGTLSIKSQRPVFSKITGF